MKIINYLKGGIGNQLFQYVFAKSIAKKFNCQLIHDKTFYNVDPYGNNSIISDIDSEAKYIETYNLEKSQIIQITDDNFKGLNEINELPESYNYILLNGYWQNESYHDKVIINELRKSLKEIYMNEICASDQNDVAVHIRRKDYEHMGLCRLEYYIGIMDKLVDKYENINFLIYTDTPNFSKEFLNYRNYKMNYIKSGSDLRDLYTMSMCNKYIISNSSFSWWAAYLGETEEKEIYAPREWITLGNVKSPCPERWKLIENSVMKTTIDEKLINYYRSQY